MPCDLTQDFVKSVLFYNPETGEFTWRGDAARRQTEGSRAGCRAPSGYIFISICRKNYGAHRLAWFYQTGVWPRVIDHKNLIRDDNRWNNLREATNTLNKANLKVKKNNKSGFKGVVQVSGGWRAQIGASGTHYYLGIFTAKEDAARAYDEKAIELFGEFARTNFGEVRA